MAEHRYHQYCALVRALDIAGDRWSLLIVRELLPGARRFTDLIEGLPGISRNLLTERLRSLEAEGIVTRQELPPPAARRVYALTQDGRDLGLAMTGLIKWGARRLDEREPGESFQPRWGGIGMTALADREATKGVRDTYEYVVGRTVFHIVVDDGSIELRDGGVADPDVRLTTDEETFADLATGKIGGAAAVDAATLKVEGDPDAIERQRAIFARKRLLGRPEPALQS